MKVTESLSLVMIINVFPIDLCAHGFMFGLYRQKEGFEQNEKFAQHFD